MKKRMISLMLVAAMALTTLVGCGNNTVANNAPVAEATETADVVEVVKEDITITVIAPQDHIKPYEEELALKFEEETGIKVVFNIIPSDQYDNLLMTRLNSGEAMDIFSAQSGELNLGARYQPDINCVDLSGESWVSTVDSVVLDATSYQGKVYGLQIWNTSAVWAVNYNKAIFADLGLSIPTTYAEFVAVCETIKAAGITPMYEPVSDGWHHVLQFAELGVKLDAIDSTLYDQLNTNSITCAEIPEMLTLVEQINEVAQNYSGDYYLANEVANGAAELSEGNYAMMINRVTFPQEMEAAFPDGTYKAADFGSFVMPYLDNQIVNFNPQGPSKFISNKSENVDACKQYLAYLASTESLQGFIDNEPSFTTLPFSGLESNFTDQEKEFFDMYPETGIVLQSGVKYIDPQWMDIGKYLSSMYTGQMTALEVLESIDQSRTDQAIAAEDPDWK